MEDCYHHFQAILYPLEDELITITLHYQLRYDFLHLMLAHSALESAMESDGLADKADFDFHLAVAKITGNDYFVHILTALNAAIVSGMQVALKITKDGSHDRQQKIREEHRAIFNAVAIGDTAAADLAMRYHIHRARTRVTDHLRDQ